MFPTLVTEIFFRIGTHSHVARRRIQEMFLKINDFEQSTDTLSEDVDVPTGHLSFSSPPALGKVEFTSSGRVCG